MKAQSYVFQAPHDLNKKTVVYSQQGKSTQKTPSSTLKLKQRNSKGKGTDNAQLTLSGTLERIYNEEEDRPSRAGPSSSGLQIIQYANPNETQNNSNVASGTSPLALDVVTDNNSPLSQRAYPSIQQSLTSSIEVDNADHPPYPHSLGSNILSDKLQKNMIPHS